jgi:hypothetical protein
MRHALRLVAVIVISTVVSSQHVLASGQPGVGGTGANGPGAGTTAGVGASMPIKGTVQIPQVLPNTGGARTPVGKYDDPIFTAALAVAVLLLGALLVAYNRRWRPGVA